MSAWNHINEATAQNEKQKGAAYKNKWSRSIPLDQALLVQFHSLISFPVSQIKSKFKILLRKLRICYYFCFQLAIYLNLLYSVSIFHAYLIISTIFVIRISRSSYFLNIFFLRTAKCDICSAC